MWKKVLRSSSVLGLAASLAIPTASFAEVNAGNGSEIVLKDIKGHWAEQTIQSYTGKGLISGYEDGSFRPDSSISRAEFATLMNKAFSLQEPGTPAYTDVKAGDWYYEAVGAAQKSGYMSGYEDGTFRANASITRQEMAVIFSKLLSLKDSGSARSYSDTANSPEWSIAAIGGVIDAGLMKGYENQLFKPQGNVSRAEAITVIDRALNEFKVTYSEGGTYGPADGVETIQHDVAITAPGVTLRNMEIKGNLLLGKEIGEGDVFLQNVKVAGTTTVQGGGENSIHLEDSIMVTVVVDKASGKVRIVANGATRIADITVQSDVKLEANGGSKINSVTMSEALPPNSQVQMVGSFETVNIVAKNIVVEIPKGAVKEFNVANQANGSKVNVGKEAAIISLIVNAAANIVGQGNVQNATINASGVSMEKAPEKTTKGADAPADLKLNIGGSDVAVGEPSASNAGGGSPAANPGSSGGSSGSGSDDSDSGSDNGGSNPGPTPDQGGSDPDNGGSDPNPAPDDGSSDPDNGGQIPTDPLPTGPLPTILQADYEGTVGQSVYVASDRAGTVYIVESGVTRSLTVLDEAVNTGRAVKYALSTSTVTEGVYSADVPTNGLSKTKVSFVIFVVGEDNQISDPRFVTLLAAPEDVLEFAFDAYRAGDYTNKGILFIFNKTLVNNLASLDALKAAITFSDDGVNFRPLAANDRVELFRNEITVYFDEPYRGENNKLRLAAGAVRDPEGHVYDQELTTNAMKAMPIVTKASTATTFTIGEPIEVQVNAPATIYLVREDFQWNTRFDLENEVVAKRASKVVVGQDDVDRAVQLLTADLSAGYYSILLYGANSIHVKLQ
ncbi:S-layer homology domain-containing protein [Paenibacillus chartarius]|uniref:S-layer homology domain-containing protein n=1 Tax=Paenibacillus chartarius TaxID=747481 RepID=A0ABV6DL52_9BACL